MTTSAGVASRRAALALCTVLAMSATPASAQSRYEPTSLNLAARAWFQDARFGLFIHWGIHSVLQDGE